jgi:hypothetical protein
MSRRPAFLPNAGRCLTSTLALLGAVLTAGCAADLVGTGDKLRIVAPSSELAQGSDLELRAVAGGIEVAPAAVEWLSRDPSTVTVRDGVAHGVFPGIAWVLAIRRNAVDSMRLTVHFSDLAGDETGIRNGNQLVRLGGVGLLTKVTGSSVTWQTSILASSGALVEFPNGVCCQVLGDTLLQVSFGGQPAVGARTLIAPDVRIEQRLENQLLQRRGPDDLLLMVRDGDFRMRFYMPVRESTLEILAVTLPTETTGGRIRGRLSFEAAGVFQVYDRVGNSTYTPIGDTTTHIYAEFDSPMRFQTFSAPVPPGLQPAVQR